MIRELFIHQLLTVCGGLPDLWLIFIPAVSLLLLHQLYSTLPPFNVSIIPQSQDKRQSPNSLLPLGGTMFHFLGHCDSASDNNYEFLKNYIIMNISKYVLFMKLLTKLIISHLPHKWRCLKRLWSKLKLKKKRYVLFEKILSGPHRHI